MSTNVDSLQFQMLDITSYDMYIFYDNRISFSFETIIQVTNPTSENITFTHNDGCGFRVNITYYEDDHWDNSFKSACFQAIVPEVFVPGKTNTSGIGWINFFDLSLKQLHNGRYSITMGFHTSQTTSNVLNLGFTVDNGQITSKLRNFDGWNTNQSTNQFKVSLMIIIPYLFLIPVIKKRSPS